MYKEAVATRLLEDTKVRFREKLNRTKKLTNDIQLGMAKTTSSGYGHISEDVRRNEQTTTRDVLSETQQVVEAPTTSEVISEDTKPVNNEQYNVHKVRYVNKGNADT